MRNPHKPSGKARSRSKKFKYAYEAIGWHFAGLSHDEIVTTSRQFPGHMRVDVQVALEELFSASPIRFFGLYEQHRYETLTFASLSKDGQHAITISAAQYQDVDIGEGDPIKCLNNGLWLNRNGDLRYAVVLSFHREHGQEAGTCVEIAVPAGEEAGAFVQLCFAELESAMNAGQDFVDGDLCDHFAFRQRRIDWQVWIASGGKPLPRKIVVTYRGDDARPQSISLIDWNLKPAFKDSEFKFVPPKGATKIEIVPVKSK